MSKFYRFIKCVGGALVSLVFRQKTLGLENLPENGGYIICCNHTHFMDVAFLAIAFPRQIYFMAKKELFDIPIGKWFCKNMGAFPVARGTGTGAASAVKTAEDIVNSGKIMGIFPEGTRSPDGKPKRAKSGIAVIAASTEAPVVPISIYYEGKLKLFKKITLRIGKPIEGEEIKLKSQDRSELKRVSSLIMGKITEQWEMGHSL